MKREYFIYARAMQRKTYKYVLGGSFERSIFGIDEFDALNKFVVRTCKEDFHGNINPEDFYVRAYIRPTGRIDSKPFFPCDETVSYNKATLSRFMIRFLASETEEQLIRHGNNFKHFIKRREELESSFSNNSITQMRAVYQEQMQKIRSGEIIPEDFNLRTGLPSSPLSPSERLSHYENRAVDLLRKRGFRIEQTENQYKITTSRFHRLLDTEEETDLVSPTGLILFCEREETYKLSIDFWNEDSVPRELKRSNPPAVFEYLGMVSGVNYTEHEIAKFLESSGIYPVIWYDDIRIPYIEVLKEEGEAAKAVLKKKGIELPESLDDFTL